MSKILEKIAEAICSRVGACAMNDQCRKLGLSCREERMAEARLAVVAAIDAVQDPANAWNELLAALE